MKKILFLVFMFVCSSASGAVTSSDIRLKEICRLAGKQDNALVGYGIVTGLAGTGDSSRSLATMQSIKNILIRFGVNVPVSDVRSRNSAAVMVTTNLPAYARPGDKLDINVTSMGDARSLLGGTLLLAHLNGSDNAIYALAQGSLSVGGYKYDLNGNVVQKNHPTTANVPSGAIVERAVSSVMVDADGFLEFVLFDPDFSTAERISESLRKLVGPDAAVAVDAARVRVKVPVNERDNPVGFIAKLENTTVIPDRIARVVVNERTGTVVSGGGVTISPVSITHGNISVVITTEYQVSQPLFIARGGSNISTEVVPNTTVEANEELPINVTLQQEASIAELITALNKVRASSRDIITILQAVKRAGALHAELVIQ